MTGRPGRIAEDHKLLLHTIERPSDGFRMRGPIIRRLSCKRCTALDRRGIAAVGIRSRCCAGAKAGAGQGADNAAHGCGV